MNRGWTLLPLAGSGRRDESLSLKRQGSQRLSQPRALAVGLGLRDFRRGVPTAEVLKLENNSTCMHSDSTKLGFRLWACRPEVESAVDKIAWLQDVGRGWCQLQPQHGETSHLGRGRKQLGSSSSTCAPGPLPQLTVLRNLHAPECTSNFLLPLHGCFWFSSRIASSILWRRR